MKTLFRILIVLSFLAIIFYYSTNSRNEYEPLEGPNYSTQILPKIEDEEELQVQNESLPKPNQGLSTYIGKESDILLENYGEPNRYDSTTYGYKWWVYNEGAERFVMFAVEDNLITQVYTSAEQQDITPFHIGQPLQEIYQMILVNPEVIVTIDENIYTFTLSEEDMNTRILTKFDDVLAQLYIDSEEGSLSGIRFTDSKTLVLQRPYEMSFVGELLSPPSPTSYLIEESNKASATQLFDLVNVFREQKGYSILKLDSETSILAKEHSEEMYKQNYLSHESPTKGSLKSRLEEKNLAYDEAEENIATAYIDAIEASHGWLNSKMHRKNMLNPNFNQVGSGVFMNYYTQIFTQYTTNIDEMND